MNKYKTKMILAAIMALPNFAYAVDYDSSTPTINSWQQVTLDTDKTYSGENSIIGIDHYNVKSKGIVITPGKTVTITSNSPDMITILGRPLPTQTVEDMDGLYMETNTSGQTTSVTVDSVLAIDTDISTQPNNTQGINLIAKANNANTNATFKKDLSIKVISRTESGSANAYGIRTWAEKDGGSTNGVMDGKTELNITGESTAYGIYQKAATGAGNKLAFTDLNINSEATKDGYGIRQDTIGNGSKNEIDLNGAGQISAQGGNSVRGILQATEDNALAQIKAAELKIEAQSTANSVEARGISQEGKTNGKSSIESEGSMELFASGTYGAYALYQGTSTGAESKVKAAKLVSSATSAGNSKGIYQTANGANSINMITVGGDTELTATGGSSAYGLHQNAQSGGSSKFIANNLQVEAGATGGTVYGVYQYARFEDSENDITLDGSLTVKAEGVGNASGVYQYANDTSDSSQSNLTVASNIDIAATSTDKEAVGLDQNVTGAKGSTKTDIQGQSTLNVQGKNGGYGAYQLAKNGGTAEIIFRNGLQAVVKSENETIALYAGTNGAENSKSLITADGDIQITANDDGSGYVAKAEGNGSEINLNQKSLGTVVLKGNTLAKSFGKIAYNLNKADSSIAGDLYAYTEGKIDLVMDGSDILFQGLADNTGTAGKGIINVDMANDSVWEMTGSSSVNNVNLNSGGLIDMSAGKDFQVLTTENLTGTGGIFKLAIDASNNVDNSDQIYVTGTFTGEQLLELKEVGGGDLNGAGNTVLARVSNNEGTFKAVDGEGTLYYNRYELDSKDTDDDTNSIFTKDWYLKSIITVDPDEKPTPGVDGAVSMGALAYYTWLDHDQLMKRMGDLRHKGEDEKGIWVRLKGAKIERNGNFGFKNKYTHYELGYDEIMKEKPNYTRYGGVSISYADGDSSYSRGNGDTNSRAVNFYMTEMGNKGHYLDLVLRFHHMDSNFKMFDEDGKKIRGDMENFGVSLSGEYGRKKMLDDKGLYIEPQGQLTLGYLGGDNYTTTNGIEVDQGGIRSALGRLGFNLGKDIDEKTNIYVKLNLLHEFGGGYHATMTDSSGRVNIDRSLRDTWLEYGIGAAIQTGKNNHLYFDFERSTGGDFKKDWSWNVGARWTF